MDNSRIKCILGMTFHSTNFAERKNNVFMEILSLVISMNISVYSSYPLLHIALRFY